MKSIKRELKRSLYFSVILPIVFIILAIIVLVTIRNYTVGLSGCSTSSSGRAPEAVKIFFVTVSIGVVGITLVLNSINTRRLLQRIQSPLSVLEKTVLSIGDGNYDIKINYQVDDEFKGICDSLDLMSKQLQVAINKYENVEKARREFLVGISHDLRTPLTAIKGYVSGLQDGVAVTPAKQKHYLSNIDVKVEELEYLIHQIFFLSKLEAEQYPFEMVLIPAKTVLQSMFDELGLQYYKYIESEVQNNLDDDTRILGDTRELFRVFQNVFENTEKYGLSENSKITVNLQEQEKFITIEIHDNGNGVSEKNIAQLFESGFREDKSRKKAADSNGFGLKIVKLIIEAHGGNVSLENDNGFKIIINLLKEVSVND